MKYRHFTDEELAFLKSRVYGSVDYSLFPASGNSVCRELFHNEKDYKKYMDRDDIVYLGTNDEGTMIMHIDYVNTWLDFMKVRTNDVADDYLRFWELMFKYDNWEKSPDFVAEINEHAEYFKEEKWDVAKIKAYYDGNGCLEIDTVVRWWLLNLYIDEFVA